MTKQFADKTDTKKALKLLEKQIKNIFDLYLSKGGGISNGSTNSG